MAKKNTAVNAAGTATATPDRATSGTDAGGVPGGPSGAVWDALQANPGASVAVIAAAAGVVEHKARRALAALEIAGHVMRTSGRRAGGKRLPDAWRPATTGSAEPAADTATGVDESGPADQVDAAPAEDAPAALDADATATAAETSSEPGALRTMPRRTRPPMGWTRRR